MLSQISPTFFQAVDCDVVQAELQDYLDGELDAIETRAIRRHLRTCLKCRQDAQLLYSTLVLLRHLPNLEPEGAYWDFATRRVLKKIPVTPLP